MQVRQSRYTTDAGARRGDEIYERDVRSHVEPLCIGEVVAIDLDSGAWEVDPNGAAAERRLEKRYPNAQVWMMRIGTRDAPYQRRTRTEHCTITDVPT
jgi:hypothetical protein